MSEKNGPTVCDIAPEAQQSGISNWRFGPCSWDLEILALTPMDNICRLNHELIKPTYNVLVVLLINVTREEVIMAFIRTIPVEEATDKLKEIYDGELKSLGYVANGTLALSLRPDVFEAWEHLAKIIRSKMRLRRYELVTLITASALHCTY